MPSTTSTTLLPTILIVPGSFAPAHLYAPLISALQNIGFDTKCFVLPSAARKPGGAEKAATLYEDAAFFNGALSVLCAEGRDVVLLCHSFGGCVATECVKGLTRTTHGPGQGRGRVRGIVYLTAAIPRVGESMAVVMAELEADYMLVEGDFMYHRPEKTAPIVYNDIPLAEGVGWVELFTYHSVPSFGSELTYAGYKDVDQIAYIFCDKDECLPLRFQDKMVETARSGGRPVEVYHLSSAGHMPINTALDALVETVHKALRAQFC